MLSKEVSNKELSKDMSKEMSKKMNKEMSKEMNTEMREQLSTELINKEMLEQVIKYSSKPALYAKGTDNIWTEPYIAEQMLQNHLDLQTDLSSRKEETINQTVKFLNEHIGEESTILDLGCGPGLYDERLCESGHKVTGVDFSENSIKYAKKNAQKEGLNIEYLCHDIFDLEYKECYDMVMQIYGEINTFSEEERVNLFSMVHKALKPNGLFIFDVTTPNIRGDQLKKNWYVDEQGFWSKGKHLVLEEEFRYDNNIWLEQSVVIEEDKVRVYRNWYQEYTKETIEAVVLAAGFDHVQVLENLYDEKKVEKTNWLTVIAYK